MLFEVAVSAEMLLHLVGLGVGDRRLGRATPEGRRYKDGLGRLEESATEPLHEVPEARRLTVVDVGAKQPEQRTDVGVGRDQCSRQLSLTDCVKLFGKFRSREREDPMLEQKRTRQVREGNPCFFRGRLRIAEVEKRFSGDHVGLCLAPLDAGVWPSLNSRKARSQFPPSSVAPDRFAESDDPRGEVVALLEALRELVLGGLDDLDATSHPGYPARAHDEQIDIARGISDPASS